MYITCYFQYYVYLLLSDVLFNSISHYIILDYVYFLFIMFIIFLSYTFTYNYKEGFNLIVYIFIG